MRDGFCTGLSSMEEVGKMDTELLRHPQSLFKVPQGISIIFMTHLKKNHFSLKRKVILDHENSTASV